MSIKTNPSALFKGENRILGGNIRVKARSKFLSF